MNDKVDVLAVMEELAGKIWRQDDSDPILALADEARAAVAELIDKAENAMFELKSLEEAMERERGHGLSINTLMERGEAVEYADLCRSIARVKGE